MTRNAMLAKVHVARKQLDMDEAGYRELLQRAIGKASARDCTEAELERALGEFRRLGWKPVTTPAASGRGKSEKPHVRKIFALWGSLARTSAINDGSRPALVSFIERQTGVSHPDWLTAAQANSVTEALKAIQQRSARK